MADGSHGGNNSPAPNNNPPAVPRLPAPKIQHVYVERGLGGGTVEKP
jgi:hypothetical protein